MIAHTPPAAEARPAGPDLVRPLPASSLRWTERLGLRLWHRILSAGTSEVALLRGWDRVVAWRAHSTRRKKLRALRRFLALPVKAARTSYKDVRSFGGGIAELWGISRSRQFRQLWWLKVRHGADAEDYILFQLYRPERWRRAAEYVPVNQFTRVLRFLNARKAPKDTGILMDKRWFDAWCRENEIPTVTTLLEFNDGRVTGSTIGDGPLPARDLFSKPANWGGGYGARRFNYDGNGGYVGPDGKAREPRELVQELAATSATLVSRRTGRSRGLLLQECVRNHHSLAPLTTGGLCTVRLQTCRPPGGEAQLLFAIYRMPTGRAPVDNFHSGGLAAYVDLETGRLGQAVRRLGKLIVDIDRHPDTGAMIDGVHLPFWTEAVALVLRAHRALPTIPVVGWDVGILEDGPIIVEGNSRPGADIPQMVSGVPLGTTPLVAWLNAHLRECFTSGAASSGKSGSNHKDRGRA